MKKLKKYTPTEFMADDSHYDKAAADYAVNFIECLSHTKGTWAGKPFELLDWHTRSEFGLVRAEGVPCLDLTRRGYKDMSPPTKELMRLTLNKMIAHGGHPVLRWMMDNIFIKRDPAGNIKPDKEKSTEKIDGAVLGIRERVFMMRGSCWCCDWLDKLGVVSKALCFAENKLSLKKCE